MKWNKILLLVPAIVMVLAQTALAEAQEVEHPPTFVVAAGQSLGTGVAALVIRRGGDEPSDFILLGSDGIGPTYLAMAIAKLEELRTPSLLSFARNRAVVKHGEEPSPRAIELVDLGHFGTVDLFLAPERPFPGPPVAGIEGTVRYAQLRMP